MYTEIENGNFTKVKELLLDICPHYGVKIKDGVVQYRTPNNYYKERLDKIVKEYADFQNKTDKENLKYIDEIFEKLNQEKEELINHYKDKKSKYRNMIEQLKLWNHTEIWDKMYNDMMEGLVKEYECAERIILEYKDKIYKKETLEEFKTRTIEDYLKRIKKYSDDYFEDIENTERNNQIIKEFEDSLKELKTSNNEKERKQND